MSRLAMDVVDSGLDLSKDPKFTEAVAHKVYYGPVYFRRESEPYMTLSLAGTRKDAGVSIAEVNLKLIRDVVSQIKVGEHGHAYVVGAQGRLIAHPDISLVLRNTDMSKLAQVQAARARAPTPPVRRAAGREEYPGSGSPDRIRADRAAGLDHVRRASGRGGLCVAVSGAAAARHRAAGRLDLRGAGRDVSWPGAWSCRSRPCAPAPSGSAAAISPSASRSRPATNSKGSPTSSTTWARGCRKSLRRPGKQGRVQRTAELSEFAAAADRDRRSAQVISRSSGFDLQPVFDAIVDTSAPACAALNVGRFPPATADVLPRLRRPRLRRPIASTAANIRPHGPGPDHNCTCPREKPIEYIFPMSVPIPGIRPGSDGRGTNGAHRFAYRCCGTTRSIGVLAIDRSDA